jgi:hypothetical protein
MGILIIPTATTAQRTGITPDAGELIYDTDNNNVYKGNGSTVGGVVIGGGGGAVDSVNSQTGVVVLDADDIDDTSTTHKFTTAGQLAFNTWQQAIEALATNTVALDASDAMFQTVTWQSGSRTPTFTGFDTVYRSFVLEIDVSDAPTITWTNVDNWLTDSGVAPTITGLDVIRVLFDSYDSGTTINGTLVGAR